MLVLDLGGGRLLMRLLIGYGEEVGCGRESEGRATEHK